MKNVVHIKRLIVKTLIIFKHLRVDLAGCFGSFLLVLDGFTWFCIAVVSFGWLLMVLGGCDWLWWLWLDLGGCDCFWVVLCGFGWLPVF